MRRGKRNKVIIFILIGIVCMMGVGYAAFQTQLDIKGNTEISSEWNIRIISAEVSDTGGSAENVKNTYTDLTANLEANLYSKGDYVEYKVIVENAGTFDAKLDTLGITNSNNEAVKITSTGLVKGQTLYKGETATLTVRIEYNSNYEGDASGTGGEATIDLGFVQNSEGTIVPTTDHLVTYDYTTNGGESTNAENEYVAEGTSINLSYTATKKNYEFKGWNTNPQAAEGLSDLTMGTEDITLYAIFEAIDTTSPIIESINTSSTTNSITAVVIASDEESGISKYEFSIDGGKTWIDNGLSNTYTFTGLKQGTSYNIDVRVTNGVDMSSSSNTNETTLTIEKPIFSESIDSDGITVTITYPGGCGSKYTCTYVKDNGEEVEVNTSATEVSFQTDGILVAKVSDGINSASSSYTVVRYNLYVASYGSDETGNGTIENPYATIGKAYDEAYQTATIYVMDDITANETITFDDGKTIYLTSYSEKNDINSVIKGGSVDTLITLKNGNLNLKNITINGNNVKSINSTLIVESEAIINLLSDTTLKNCQSTNSNGAALRLQGGTVTIDGATITNNTSSTDGGAIFVYGNGNLTINDGTITNNKASSSAGNGYGLGGAIIAFSSYINIAGGTISNNSAIDGGGIWANSDAYIKVNGGTIDNNTSNKIIDNNINYGGSNFYDGNGDYTLDAKVKKIVTAENDSSVVDVYQKASKNGTNVQIYNPTGATNQQWKLIPAKIIDGIVYYRFQSQVNGSQYMYVEASNPAAGTNVQTWEIGSWQGQFWSLKKQEDNYYIIKSILGTCLDLTAHSVTNGNNVQVWTCTTDTNQKWSIE